MRPVNDYVWQVERHPASGKWAVVRYRQAERGGAEGMGYEEAIVPSQTLGVRLAQALGAAYWDGRCQERRDAEEAPCCRAAVTAPGQHEPGCPG